MSERAWRNVLIVGTVLSFIVLFALTVHSLNEVVSARTPEVTDQVAAGKKLWQSRNCNDCHTILGIGGYFAADLTKVASTRDAAWLSAWLVDTKAINPKTTMPNQRLSAAEAQDLVAFLQWVNSVDTNDWPPKPMLMMGGSGTSPSGTLVYQQKGCAACHTVNGQGGKIGPDLTHFGSKSSIGLANDAASVEKWLTNPAAVKPGTAMPTIQMTDAERKALADYLAGLK